MSPLLHQIHFAVSFIYTSWLTLRKYSFILVIRRGNLLRLEEVAGSRLKWVVGLFYLKDWMCVWVTRTQLLLTKTEEGIITLLRVALLEVRIFIVSLSHVSSSPSSCFICSTWYWLVFQTENKHVEHNRAWQVPMFLLNTESRSV